MSLSATVVPVLSFLAQATQATGPAGAATQPAGKAPSIMDYLAGPFVPLALIMVVFYIFVIRSKRNQDRKVQEARDQMKKGDEVQTIGGIIGKIIEVRDSRVLVKVDENSNTKIWFSRNAIHRVLTEEKAEAAK